MISNKEFSLLAALFLLAGCANDPSVTSNELVRSGPTGAPVVSICYSADYTTRADVIDLARAECPADRQTLKVWDHNTLLNECPITKKNRVSFLCLR